MRRAFSPKRSTNLGRSTKCSSWSESAPISSSLLAPLDIPLRGLTALARAHRVRGNRDEAAAILAHLEEIAVLHSHDRTLACALGEQVTWHLADGDLDGASNAMRRLAPLAERHPLEPLNATSEIPLLAERNASKWTWPQGRPREALERADRLLARCKAWRRNQLVATSQLLVARAHLDLRDCRQRAHGAAATRCSSAGGAASSARSSTVVRRSWT